MGVSEEGKNPCYRLLPGIHSLQGEIRVHVRKISLPVNPFLPEGLYGPNYR
jgi:hypothetical protein